MRIADADSPNMAIPTATPPIAPMPVQTAYAVPIGIVRMATASSQTLSAIPTAHTTSATGFRKPFDILSAVSHTTSNSQLKEYLQRKGAKLSRLLLTRQPVL